MLFVVFFIMLLTVCLFCLYFLNKIYLFPLFFLGFIFIGVIYTFKYRDINDIAWFIIDGKTYKHEISKNFKFKTSNIIEIELNRNITYKLEFEFIPYQQSESDVKKFENMLRDMKNLKASILKKENSSKAYGTFNLYQNVESSWNAGTIIYLDNSRNPFITGFSSENFSIPFSLNKQKIYLKFDIHNEELLGYLNKHQINLFISQKSF